MRASTSSRSSPARRSPRWRFAASSRLRRTWTTACRSSTPLIDAWQGVGFEAILTFFLVWVVFATAADPRGTFKAIAGLAIGLTITLGILAAGPLTGAAMNPARAFGPELVQGVWTDAWVYYVGPVLGGVVAALAYEWLYLRPLAPVPVGPPETGVRGAQAGRRGGLVAMFASVGRGSRPTVRWKNDRRRKKKERLRRKSSPPPTATRAPRRASRGQLPGRRPTRRR